MIDDESDYFSSYGELHIHEILLRDSQRMKTYAEVLQKNEHEFRNKIVLDVGSGTGFEK